MDAIQAARELGKAIQADERYIIMALASQKSEEDTKLQSMITSFNKQRSLLNAELQNPEKEQAKIQELDKALKSQYQLIMDNDNMKAFNAARSELEKMIGFVNQIISGSTQGLDPDTIEYEEACGGNCGSCGGCS